MLSLSQGIHRFFCVNKLGSLRGDGHGSVDPVRLKPMSLHRDRLFHREALKDVVGKSGWSWRLGDKAEYGRVFVGDTHKPPWLERNSRKPLPFCGFPSETGLHC